MNLFSQFLRSTGLTSARAAEFGFAVSLLPSTAPEYARRARAHAALRALRHPFRRVFYELSHTADASFQMRAARVTSALQRQVEDMRARAGNEPALQRLGRIAAMMGAYLPTRPSACGRYWLPQFEQFALEEIALLRKRSVGMRPRVPPLQAATEEIEHFNLQLEEGTLSAFQAYETCISRVPALHAMVKALDEKRHAREADTGKHTCNFVPSYDLGADQGFEYRGADGQTYLRPEFRLLSSANTALFKLAMVGCGSRATPPVLESVNCLAEIMREECRFLDWFLPGAGLERCCAGAPMPALDAGAMALSEESSTALAQAYYRFATAHGGELERPGPLKENLTADFLASLQTIAARLSARGRLLPSSGAVQLEEYDYFADCPAESLVTQMVEMQRQWLIDPRRKVPQKGLVSVYDRAEIEKYLGEYRGELFALTRAHELLSFYIVCRYQSFLPPIAGQVENCLREAGYAIEDPFRIYAVLAASRRGGAREILPEYGASPYQLTIRAAERSLTQRFFIGQPVLIMAIVRGGEQANLARRDHERSAVGWQVLDDVTLTVVGEGGTPFHPMVIRLDREGRQVPLRRCARAPHGP